MFPETPVYNVMQFKIASRAVRTTLSIYGITLIVTFTVRSFSTDLDAGSGHRESIKPANFGAGMPSSRFHSSEPAIGVPQHPANSGHSNSFSIAVIGSECFLHSRIQMLPPNSSLQCSDDFATLFRLTDQPSSRRSQPITAVGETGGLAASSTLASNPPSERLRRLSSAPRALASCLAMASPKPVPPVSLFREDSSR